MITKKYSLFFLSTVLIISGLLVLSDFASAAPQIGDSVTEGVLGNNLSGGNKKIYNVNALGIATSSAPTAYKLEVHGGNAYFSGNITTGGTVTAGAGFSGSVTGAISASYVSAGVFGSSSTKGNYTFQAAANTNPVLFVDATNERVGIGTTAPGHRLDIQRASGAQNEGEIKGADGTQWWKINSNQSAGAYNPLVQAGDTAFIYSKGAVDTGALVIAPHTASTKGIRIDSSGNVGIGTAAPTTGLQIYTTQDINATGVSGIAIDSNGWTALGMNGPTATKSFIMHYGGATDNKIRFGRYANNFGAWEANMFYFDLDDGLFEATTINEGGVALSAKYAPISVTGDITGVTAGTGLTGGGTSGDVTLNVTDSYVNTTGDTVTGQITVDGISPQMKFNDTTAGEDDFWIHVNSNIFYVLTDRTDSGTWSPPYALSLNSSNNTGLLFGSTIWRADNDGAGSGLDADLLDGISSASFSQGAHTTNTDYCAGGTCPGLTISASNKISFGGYVSTNDHIQLYGAGAVTGYGIGVESSTTYYRANGIHRWYIGTLADGGVSDKMELTSAGLTVNGATVSTGAHTTNTTCNGISCNVTNTGTLDGLNPTTAGTGSTIMSRDVNGDTTVRYLNSSYVNMTHGVEARTADTVFYSSTDNYIRKNNAASMLLSLGAAPLASPTFTGSVTMPGTGIWNSSGNVGIGTAGPLSTLSVGGAGVVNAGVYGYNASTYGVYGQGGTYGVFGDGGAGTGVYGTGDYGLHGNGTVRGVYGQSGAYGVYGYSTGAAGAGVYAYSVATTGFGVFCNAALNVNGCGGNRAWSISSDKRLKTNIITLENPLEKVLALRGVNFEWKTIPGKTQIGFIAQEVMDVVPEVVGTGPDGYYTMKQSELTALLTEAIKEQQKQIESLKSQIEELKNKR